MPSLLRPKYVHPSVLHLHNQLPMVTMNMLPMERTKRASLSVNCQSKDCRHVNHLFIARLFPGLYVCMFPIGYSVVVTLTGLPIGYSVIVALTGLPIGYSVIVALTDVFII